MVAADFNPASMDCQSDVAKSCDDSLSSPVCSKFLQTCSQQVEISSDDIQARLPPPESELVHRVVPSVESPAGSSPHKAPPPVPIRTCAQRTLNIAPRPSPAHIKDRIYDNLPNLKGSATDCELQSGAGERTRLFASHSESAGNAGNASLAARGPTRPLLPSQSKRRMMEAPPLIANGSSIPSHATAGGGEVSLGTLLRLRHNERCKDTDGQTDGQADGQTDRALLSPGGAPPRRSPSSIGSFTTEDMDMFPKSSVSGAHVSPPSVPVVCARDKKSAAASRRRSSRRRSKSVGAPGFRLKFNLFNEKPRVPIKPKFADQLVTGCGLPELTPQQACSVPARNPHHRELQKSSASQSATSLSSSADSLHAGSLNTSQTLDSIQTKPATPVSRSHSSASDKRHKPRCHGATMAHRKCHQPRRGRSKEAPKGGDANRGEGGGNREGEGGGNRMGEEGEYSSESGSEEEACEGREGYGGEDSQTDNSGSEVSLDSSQGRQEDRESQLDALVDSSSLPSAVRLRRTVLELLTSERAYVRRLDLVDQVFHFTVVVRNRELHMFPNDVVPQMFSNIKSIYQFHHDFLLPQLERRILSEWSSTPKIGDVMRKFAPFLKLYTEYVRNFDSAISTINQWMERSPRFLKVIQDLENLPECGQLKLQHHMLEPIQRVPRYELLLKEYLRRLPEDSLDREDTIKALELVTTAACHSNEAMHKIERFRRLLDINEGLNGAFNLVDPSRDFVKEGRLLRLSARDGSLIERTLFLFTDILLVCSSLPLKIGHKQQFRIKSKIDIDGMQVVESHNLDTPNTFYMKGRQKSMEFHASSNEEKEDWMMTLCSVIAELKRKQMSRRAYKNNAESLCDEELGMKAPTWVRDKETSMCMCCCVSFTPIRRRHHCRACGIVVCNKCSANKSPLAFFDNREKRVCDPCFARMHQVKPPLELGGPTTATTEGSAASEAHGRRRPVALQVRGSDPAVISGYLNMSGGGKNWVRRWFAVHTNFVLYSFKAHQDIVAHTSLPLPGYQVCATDDSFTSSTSTTEKSFKVFHSGQNKVYCFQAENLIVRNKWIDVLQKVVLAELPSGKFS